MNNLIEIVKFIVILQLILIGLGIIVLYITKLIFSVRRKRDAENFEKTLNIIKKLDENPENLNPSVISFLKNSIAHVLTIIKEKSESFKNIDILLLTLSEKVFKPAARKLSSKRNWYKRYLAISSFYYGIDEQDEKYLIELVKDKVLLVSINAGRVIIKYPSKKSINALIDVFIKGRHLQQNAFSEIITSEKFDYRKIENIIIERIKNESNEYIKAFCYKTLTRLPRSSEDVSFIDKDIHTHNVELKVSVLEYITYLSDPALKTMITENVNDAHWEVRAVVAKSLGKTQDELTIPLLKEMLHDKEWWVRINSARSLSELGNEGLEILKNLNPQTDKFAYEVADMVLIGLKEKQDR